MPHIFCFCPHDEETYEKLAQLNLWKKAPNFRTLFNLNRLYISGILTTHPAHDIPLYAETASLKDELLEMNEHGLLTFQGQPRTAEGEEELMPPHTHKNGEPPTAIDPSEVDDNYAYCCCWADQEKDSYFRQKPYVQFCMPIDSEGTPTAACAYRLAEALCKDPRIHTTGSWPKNIKVPHAVIDEDRSHWCTKADTTSAKQYIAKYDLNGYNHFKSLHGTSCPQEILTSTPKPKIPGAYPTPSTFSTEEGGWRPFSSNWSEVCDYHLLRPRVPGFFLGSGSKTVIFVVVAMDWEGGVEDLEELILEKVHELGLPKRFPTMPASVADANATDGYEICCGGESGDEEESADEEGSDGEYDTADEDVTPEDGIVNTWSHNTDSPWNELW